MRFRWPVVLVWILLAVGLTMATNVAGPTTNNEVTLPGTDSQAAFDLLAAEFPPQQNGSSPAVYHALSGRVDDNGPNQAAITKAYESLLTDRDVAAITDPFANPAAGLISADGTYAFMPILLTINSAELTEEKAQHFFDQAMDPVAGLDMQAAVGGPIGSALSTPDTAESEKLGMLAAAVILALTFGSLVAMGMPLISAIIGLLLGLAGIWLLGTVAPIPDIGLTLARMIGLGVGIDYALFMVIKHRTFMLEHHYEPRVAAVRSVATSGGAIIFAGATVIIALLSLQIADIPFITSLGWACAVAVATAALAAVTFLPAALAILGTGVVRFRIPVVGRRTDHPIAGRWAGAVTRHPVISTVIAVGLMVPLMIPAASMTLGQEDIGVTPTDTTQRQAFDLMSAGFGPGFNGPLLVSVAMEPPAQPSTEYDEQYAEATSLQSQLEVLQVTLPQQQAELEQQQAELEQQAAALQRKADKLKAARKDLVAQAADLRRQEDQLRAEARALRVRADVLGARARELIAREAKLAKEIATSKARQKALTRLIPLAQDPQVVTRLESLLAKAERREELLRTRLAANTDKLRGVRSEADQLRGRAASLERQAAELDRQRQALLRKKERLQAQEADLKKQQADLEKQAAELAVQADDLQQQADEAQQMQDQALALQATLTQELTKAGGDPRGTDPRIVELQDALATPADVDIVVPPQINEKGDAVILSVIADTRPADPLTAALVTQLRDEAIPEGLSPGMNAYVGGSTAANVDLAALITAKLLLVILTVIALSSVLLLVAFRSLLIPVGAAIANSLAAAAAFGVLTAVFQWGWGLDAIGLDSPYGTVPVVSFVPLMMFAAMFGLSMDYQVFVVSTIQAEYARGLSARDAVREGLTRSAKIVVSAALIMMSVFGSFILNGDPVVKQFGVGLTTAVALAAFLVLLLAPALLMLFNTYSWRLPRLLDRILPDLDIEGRSLEDAWAEEDSAAPAAAG